MTLAALLTAVLLYLWLSVGRYSMMVNQKISMRDQMSFILSRIELDTKKTSDAGVQVAPSGEDSRVSLQQFSGTAQDGMLSWGPRTSLYGFFPEERVLRRWEDVVRTDASPAPQPEPLVPEELLSFDPHRGVFLRTWPMVEKATFTKSVGRPILEVKLVLHYEGPRKHGYRLETQQDFLLLNGYQP